MHTANQTMTEMWLRTERSARPIAVQSHPTLSVPSCIIFMACEGFQIHISSKELKGKPQSG
jgi:hypothetical protein